MNLKKFQALLNAFEAKYPDLFKEKRRQFMNIVSARILKVGEVYHTTVIIEKKFGGIRIEAESKYAEERVREEARLIMEEEICSLAADLLLTFFTKEVKYGI